MPDCKRRNTRVSRGKSNVMKLLQPSQLMFMSVLILMVLILSFAQIQAPLFPGDSLFMKSPTYYLPSQIPAKK